MVREGAGEEGGGGGGRRDCSAKRGKEETIRRGRTNAPRKVVADHEHLYAY